MGSNNVKQVYAHWGHLTHRSVRLLAFMANTTLDKHNPPKFYGGRESLAAALGYDVPDEPASGSEGVWADEARRKRDRAFHAVKQTVNALIAAGAIERVKVATFRSHSEYHLNLSPFSELSSWGTEGVVEQPPKGVSQQPPKGVPERPVGGPSTTLEGGGEQPPYEEDEEKGSFIGMPGQGSNGGDTRPRLKTLMNDFSSLSEEQERDRQMRELEQRMNGGGKA